MISVAVIGQGNVAHHLTKAFKTNKAITLTSVHSRSEFTLSNIDIAIIAVSDDAIATVSKKIDNKDIFVLHTSGSVSIKALQSKGSKGVLYPLQSFSKDIAVDFDKVPLCLEVENAKDLERLKQLAQLIGKQNYVINSEQRLHLHLAAVFVNNFTNHLYKMGYDICKQYNVPFEILYPLIEETALKVTKLTPEAAQTGPAKRNDIETIKKHMLLLESQQQTIYKLMTKSIQNGEEL